MKERVGYIVWDVSLCPYQVAKKKVFPRAVTGSPMSNKADPACSIPSVTVTPAGHHWNYAQPP